MLACLNVEFKPSNEVHASTALAKVLYVLCSTKPPLASLLVNPPFGGTVIGGAKQRRIVAIVPSQFREPIDWNTGLWTVTVPPRERGFERSP